MTTQYEKYEDIDADLLIDQDETDRSAILSKGITWASYVGTYITSEEHDMLNAYLVDRADRADLLRRHGKKYAKLFLVLLAKLKKTEDLRYVVTVILDTLKEVEGSHRWFYELSDHEPIPGVPDLPYGPLFSLLSRKKDDAYIVNTTSTIQTFFMVSFPKVRKDMAETIIHWFIKKLDDDSSDPQYYRTERKVLENLRIILQKQRYRLLFAVERGLEPLFEISKFDTKQQSIITQQQPQQQQQLQQQKKIHAHKIQLIYSSLYCIWLLSFHPQVRDTMIVPELFDNLCSLLKSCQDKDKVVRMALAILKNLLGIQLNDRHMVSFGLSKILLQIQSRPSLMADTDVKEDAETIQKALDKVLEEMSSFEVYFHEVQSRNLQWSSPPHKLEKFWVENCIKVEETHIIEMLKAILETENDPTVLCIACWDIGEFVRFHPTGKRIIQALDVKVPIMKLLVHIESEVRSQALLTLQKLMVTNWEYLQA